MKRFALNFSGVYEQERKAFGSERPFWDSETQLIDFSGLDGTNCYCDPYAQKTISSMLDDSGSETAIHWIDTGDYHYLTKFFLDRISEPFCLVLIDHHCDEQDSAFGCLSCGSWVRESKLSNPNLKQVFSIGPAQKAGESVFSSVFLPESATANDVRTDLPLYVSLDLDVLSCSDFLTDWDQGAMSLGHLEGLIEGLIGRRRILGIDICGGKTVEKGASDCELRGNFAVRARLHREIIDWMVQN